MPLPIFEPVTRPAVQGTNFSHRVGQRSVAFGDGYEQRSEKNLNNIRRTARLMWPALEPQETMDLVNFFKANAISGFQWTIPREGIPRQWKVNGEIQDPYADGKLGSVSVELLEIFDAV